MISSAVKSCEQKQLRMTATGEKRALWWNQDVKKDTRAKKNMLTKPCCKTFNHLICNPSIPRRQMLLLRQEKCPKNAIGKSKTANKLLR